MIEGVVSPKLEPVIQLKLVGANALETEIELAIDTGFTAGLAVPTELIRSLGWIYKGDEPTRLGDGTWPKMGYYRGIVLWHGQPRLVDVLAAEADPLLGAALLDGNKVEIEFKRGGKVTISPLP